MSAKEPVELPRTSDFGAGDLPSHPTFLAHPAILHLRREVKENSPVYVHERVYRRLKEAVGSGDLLEDERLPSNAQLAAFLHTGGPTVARAFRALAAEGLVVCRPGRGTFVARRARRTASMVDPDPPPHFSMTEPGPS